MSGIETIVLVSSLTFLGITYSSIVFKGYIDLFMNNGGSLKYKILFGLLLPFYPIVVPILMLHQCICYRPRETPNVETRNGYEGFQERTDNIANEDNKASNTNEN